MNWLVHNYLTRGFWGDEAWTSLISQLPYLQMLKTTAADFHPPAYYSIVEFIYKFLAPTEVNTRLISVIFYLLTAFMAYKLVGFAKGSVFGHVSAALVLFNPIFFRYAFEARNYTMFAFAATGSCYFLLKLFEKFDKKSALGFVTFCTLGIYTHYYMFLVLAAIGLFIVFWERKFLLKLVGLFSIVALFYLPWIPFLIKQVGSVGADYWIGAINTRTHFEAILRLLGGEEQSIFRLILFWLSIALITLGLLKRILRRSFEKIYVLLLMWVLVSVSLASLPGLAIDGFRLPFRPIFFWRYLIPLSVPFSILIVDGAWRIWPNLGRASIITILALSVTVDLFTFFGFPYSFREAYQDKISQIKPSDKIVTVLPSFAEVFYYRNRLELENEVIVLPQGLVQFSGKSLLDAYVAQDLLRIDEKPEGRFIDATQSKKIEIVNAK